MNKNILAKVTIKRAKELSKEHIGRLPRCGYEYIIFRNEHYRLSLVNHSGKFELSEWFSPNSHMGQWQVSAETASRL